MLKPFVVLSVAALVVFAYPTATTLASGGSPQANPVKPTPVTLEKAKKLYAVDCAVCHGDNGNGKTDLATSMQVTLGDWTQSNTLGNKSDQELFDAIRKGKDKMPAEDASRAKNDDVWGLILYIRGFSKGEAASAPATEAPAAAAPAAPAPASTPNFKR